MVKIKDCKRKHYYVVAYDIADDKRRYRVVKILEKLGIRINFSVFECMLTDSLFLKLHDEIAKVIDIKEDAVIYYPICRRCYTKIVYQSKSRKSPGDEVVAV